MKSRFKRALHDILIADDISIDTNIVSELTYQMMGISVSPRDGQDVDDVYSESGFYLSTSYYSDRNDEKIKFRLPELSLEQLFCCLDFLKLPKEKFKTNTSLIVDEEFVFKKFLPEFKKHYESQKQANPILFAKYRVISKGILESTAKNSIKEYTGKVINTIDENINPEEDKASGELMFSMVLLNEKVDLLNRRPIMYESIIAEKSHIDALSKTPQVASHQELSRYLKLLKESIDLFARYHRMKSVIGNKKFTKEAEDFLLSNYRISATKSDVIEDTLLRLAGATLGDRGGCKTYSGRDESRRVFEFTDINQENAEKIIKYLRDAGDETATEGRGYRKHGSVITESLECAMMPQRCEVPSDYYGNSSVTPPPEVHCVEMDGKFLYDVFFPKFKDEMTAINNQKAAIIKAYQESSKEYVDRLKNKPGANKVTLFQPQPVDEGKHEMQSSSALQNNY